MRTARDEPSSSSSSSSLARFVPVASTRRTCRKPADGTDKDSRNSRVAGAAAGRNGRAREGRGLWRGRRRGLQSRLDKGRYTKRVVDVANNRQKQRSKE